MCNWQSLWSFETRRFRVKFQITPCEEDPSDHFDNEEDVEAIREGRLDWFDSRVVIYLKSRHVADKLIAADYLGSCAYDDPSDMINGHRDSDPMNRNCWLRRECGNHGVICHYFPSMVREAIGEARDTAHMIADLA